MTIRQVYFILLFNILLSSHRHIFYNIGTNRDIFLHFSGMCVLVKLACKKFSLDIHNIIIFIHDNCCIHTTWLLGNFCNFSLVIRVSNFNWTLFFKMSQHFAI